MEATMHQISRLAIAAGLTLGTLTTAGAAIAAQPDDPDCWGVVTAQRAVSEGDVGEHSAAQDEPRLGLGNVARAILGEDAHVSDLGTFLAEADELASTECP
jgi:hypothetical protein